MKPGADITEALAAEAILDKSLKINLPSPRLLRLFGKKTIPLRFRRPTAGQLLEMSAMYVRMNIDLVKLGDGEAGVRAYRPPRSRLLPHYRARADPGKTLRLPFRPPPGPLPALAYGYVKPGRADQAYPVSFRR